MRDPAAALRVRECRIQLKSDLHKNRKANAIRHSRIPNGVALSQLLRPLDVAVALNIAFRPKPTFARLADDVGISQSTAHQAVIRLVGAGIVRRTRKRYQANVAALEEFLLHGVRYAFPAQRETRRRGVPTAHSAPVFRHELDSDVDPVVWPSAKGTVVGAAVEPLLDTAAELPGRRPDLYDALALVDALRIGTARDREVAGRLLSEQLQLVAT